MKNFFSVLLTTILLLSGLSCGKKGNILPPLVRFPQTAEDVRIVQKAEQIILTWQNPTAYDDGSALSAIEEIEIWVLEVKTTKEKETAEIQAEGFEQKAKLYATIEKDQISEYLGEERAGEGSMRYSYPLSGKDFLSTKYTFGLRIKDNKRYSPFSALISLKPVVLPLPPSNAAAVVYTDRIEIQWQPPSKNIDQSIPPNVKGYNIYRSEGEAEPQLLNAGLIKEEKYDDRNFVFGQTYKYFVRASATDTSPYLESEDSAGIEILTRDTFAPEAPKGLISVAGQDVLSISWDASEEDDLAGYRVWRREEGTEEILLLTPDPIKESAYNDREVERGKMYAYAVTALDKSGNESPRSKILIDGIRERMR